MLNNGCCMLLATTMGGIKIDDPLCITGSRYLVCILFWPGFEFITTISCPRKREGKHLCWLIAIVVAVHLLASRMDEFRLRAARAGTYMRLVLVSSLSHRLLQC